MDLENCDTPTLYIQLTDPKPCLFTINAPITAWHERGQSFLALSCLSALMSVLLRAYIYAICYKQ